MKKTYFALSIIFLFASNAWTQCYPDRHNTSWFDGWISCETAENPNSERGPSHWILYNFGQAYVLQATQIWNTNDPLHLDWGIEEAAIDYSMDGVNWTHFGDFFLDQGSGRSIYEGFEGPDFDGIEAQYVLITALSNFGGSCYGLSEIRFGTDGLAVAVEEPLLNDKWCLAVDIYPNPFVESSTVEIASNCSEEVYYSLRDALGKQLIGPQLVEGQKMELKIGGKDWVSGIYFLTVRQGKSMKQYKLMKM